MSDEARKRQALAGVSDPEAKPLAEVASLAEARRHRAEALLRSEEIPDQDVEAGCWGDSGDPKADAS